MATVKSEGEESVELPERSTEANPFSEETEASLLKLLDWAAVLRLDGRRRS